MVKVQAYAALGELPRNARATLDQAVEHNPFLCASWLQAFESKLVGERERPAYVVAECDDFGAIVLPLLIERHRLLGALKIRAMANFYTGLFDAVHDPALGADAPGVKRIARHVGAFLSEQYAGAALFEFSPVRDDSGVLAGVVEVLGAQGYAIRRYPAHGNWYESVEGLDFHEYLARRPGRVRSTLKRKRNKLARERGFEVDLYGDSARLGQNFSAYEKIYALSWKNAERSPAFIREVMCALADSGKAMMAMLRVEDVPVAAQLWVKIGATWAIFKLAYDPAYAAYSVGTILTGAAIEALFAEGPVEALDFLSGDDEYKREWMESRRQHWGYEAISGRVPLGIALRAKRRLAGVAMKIE